MSVNDNRLFSAANISKTSKVRSTIFDIHQSLEDSSDYATLTHHGSGETGSPILRFQQRPERRNAD